MHSEMKGPERSCPPEMLTPSMLLNDISRLIKNRMRREGEQSGMRQGYRRIMFHLSHGDDGGTQQDLVRHTKLSAPTISVSLGRMEAEGLVRRQPDSHDMRVIRVSLTEKGRARCAQAVAAMELPYDEMFAGFSEDECRLARDFVHRMVENLSRETEESGE